MWFEVMSFWRHVSLFALSNLHVALNMLGKAQALSMVVWAWLWPWLLAFKRQGIRAKRGWNAPMSGPSGLGTESLPIGSICGASVLARFAEGSFAVTWCWDGTCCNLRRHTLQGDTTEVCYISAKRETGSITVEIARTLSACLVFAPALPLLSLRPNLPLQIDHSGPEDDFEREEFVLNKS